MATTFSNMNIGFWRNTWGTISAQLRLQVTNPNLSQIEGLLSLWRFAGLDNLVAVWEAAKKGKPTDLSLLASLTLQYGDALLKRSTTMLPSGILSWWREINPELTVAEALYPMYELSGTPKKNELPEWLDGGPEVWYKQLPIWLDKNGEKLTYPEPWWIAVLSYLEAFPQGNQLWEEIKAESRKLMDGHKLNNVSVYQLVRSFAANWPKGTFGDQARILFQFDAFESDWQASRPLGTIDDKPLRTLLQLLGKEEHNKNALIEVSVKMQKNKSQWENVGVGQLYYEIADRLRAWLSTEDMADGVRLDLLNAVEVVLQPQLAANRLEEHLSRLRGSAVRVSGSEGRLALRAHIESVFQAWAKVLDKDAPPDQTRAEPWVQQEVSVLQRWASWAEFYAPKTAWSASWQQVIKKTVDIWRLQVRQSSPADIIHARQIALDEIANLSLRMPSPTDGLIQDASSVGAAWKAPLAPLAEVLEATSVVEEPVAVEAPEAMVEREHPIQEASRAVQEAEVDREIREEQISVEGAEDAEAHLRAEMEREVNSAFEEPVNSESQSVSAEAAVPDRSFVAEVKLPGSNVEHIERPDLSLVPASPSEDEQMLAETRANFFEEAHEILAKIRPMDEPLLDLRRSFHTIKGSGRMAQLNDFAEHAYNVEEWLNSLRDSQKSLSYADRLFLVEVVDNFKIGIQLVEHGAPWAWAFSAPTSAVNFEVEQPADLHEHAANETEGPVAADPEVVMVGEADNRVNGFEIWEDVDRCLSMMISQSDRLYALFSKMADSGKSGSAS